jgi:hypothetical protein
MGQGPRGDLKTRGELDFAQGRGRQVAKLAREGSRARELQPATCLRQARVTELMDGQDEAQVTEACIGQLRLPDSFEKPSVAS